MISIIEKKPLAWAYGRFSSDAQAEGDSLRRQTEKALNYAEKNGLNLPLENMMFDEGLSGFTGENIKTGKLGQFLKAVKDGEVPRDSYLLIEALDRLSRQHPLVVMNIMHELTNVHGIVVVMLDKNRTYDGKEHDSEFEMLDWFMDSVRGNKESARKKKLGLDNWEGKRKRADKEILTSVCPGWLKPLPKRAGFELIPPHVSIVERIYQMSIEGCGIYKITMALNAEGVPTFKGKGTWQVSTVRKILQSRTVLGEYQPHKRVEGNRHRKEPAGEPVKKYYPAIITEADFYACQAAMERRKTPGVAGRNGKSYANIFRGVAFCAECGSKMYVNQHNKYRSSKVIYCKETKNGMCDSKAWPYDKFEHSFLSFVKELDITSIIDGGTASRSQTITKEIGHLEGEKAEIQKKVKRLLAFVQTEDEPDEILQAEYQAHRKRIADIDKRSATLRQEIMHIEDSRRVSQLEAFAGFPEDLTEEELYQVRAKVAEQIRGMVESIHMVRTNAVIASRMKKAVANARTDKETEFWQHSHAVYSEPRNMDAKFLVRFKGGGSRLVFPDSKEPQEAWMVANMDFDKLRYQDGSLPKATKSLQELRVYAGLIEP